MKLETKIEDCDLDLRVKHGLVLNNLSRVKDIYELGARELLRTPNFHEKSLIKLNCDLVHHGLPTLEIPYSRRDLSLALQRLRFSGLLEEEEFKKLNQKLFAKDLENRSIMQ